jgi:peptide/nickel transport system substrate-binding protein
MLVIAAAQSCPIASNVDRIQRLLFMKTGAAGLAVLAGALALVFPGAAFAQPSHAIAMHGEPAMPDGFPQFSYVNPDAPKGGKLVKGILGTFDSLNPLIVKGLPVTEMRGYVVEGLMARGYDEPFTLYGLLARSVETDAERSFVTFRLDPRAKFSDRTPVTAKDVVFTWELLRDRGRPNYRTYYAKVAKAEALDALTVRFDLTGSDDRELPLILGLMPVLPQHAINPATFEETSFNPMIGSGPYVVEAVDAGRSVTLKRDPEYWGRDLPVNRGFWNFERVRLEYYRDSSSHFEAFKKGLYDFRPELDPSRWVTGYDFPAVNEGRVVKDAFTDGLPKGMLGLVFNTRRAVFADIRVRQALMMLFDFEWINKNFFFDQYRRTTSYFEDSELSSHGIPANARERELLAPFPGAVTPDIMDGKWSPPHTDGSGRDRETLKQALALLKEAGYALDGTRLRNNTTGLPFSFEIMVTTRDQERLALQFAQQVKRAGIEARVRMVDAVQFDQRRLSFDFDMIQNRWDASLSPGNEQAFYWGSAAADQDGTRNYMGVKSPAVDAMIAALLRAHSRADFVDAVRALDRVLLSGSYVIPLYYGPQQWVARWTTVDHPERTSLSGYLPETWWWSSASGNPR